VATVDNFFTARQHEQLALGCFRSRNQLTLVALRISHQFGKSSKSNRAAQRAVLLFDQLRNELERHYGELTRQGLYFDFHSEQIGIIDKTLPLGESWAQQRETIERLLEPILAQQTSKFAKLAYELGTKLLEVDALLGGRPN
jgi:hypothetical protein